MRKYIYIFKSEFMSSLQYVSNVFINYIGYFIMMFMFWNLWKYMYQDEANLINGYTMNQMVWYVAMTEILWYGLGGRKLCRRITDDVRSGNITYNLNKPYSYISYIVFSHLGEILIRTILYTVLSLTLFNSILGEFPIGNVYEALGVFITAFLAIVISILIITSIGLISFFMEDASPIYWIYSKIILVLGTLFPVEFFPMFLQKVFKFVPAYVVSYGPAKLFVDFSIDKFVEILIVQLCYLLVSLLVANLIYKKGVKKLNVNGG